MSLNQSLNITLGSLRNNQYALTVVSQNIANVHVDGYVKQDVVFETNPYTTDCHNVISTIKGMNGASVSALRDYLDNGALKDLINTNSDAQYYNALADSMNGLEDIIDALGDTGLNAKLNDFYAAAANLEQFPDDIAIRQQYILKAQNVCDSFNEISTKLNAKEDESVESIQYEVDIVNNLIDKLAKANESYIKSGRSPEAQSEIQDVLKELSNYINVSSQTNPNGTVSLFIGNTKVVQGPDVNYTIQSKIDRDNPDNMVSLYLQSTENEDAKINNVNSAIKSGSLGAKLSYINGVDKSIINISDIRSKVDDAANVFASKLNEIQTQAETLYDEDGNPYDVFPAHIKTENGKTILSTENIMDMFVASDGSANINASNISINSQIIDDPFLVAAARIDSSKYEGDEWKLAVGNSDNATRITDLQNQKICSFTNPNDTTLSKYLTNLAAKLGTDSKDAKDKAEMYDNIAQGAATTYSNLTGVNLDDELADMLKYQRAYEASARLFATIDQMIQTIIGMV